MSETPSFRLIRVEYLKEHFSWAGTFEACYPEGKSRNEVTFVVSDGPNRDEPRPNLSVVDASSQLHSVTKNALTAFLEALD
ncbi:hypothetical protein IWQ49_006400 [Labrenzia sp. EL_126]|nr:hypothetical protein [Labrenzia sp. EL_126]